MPNKIADRKSQTANRKKSAAKSATAVSTVKKTGSAVAKKTVKPVASKAIKSKRAVESKSPRSKGKGTSLTAPLFDVAGKNQGKIALPKEVFGQKPNKKLLAQALYIYFTNQTAHFANTKTRSETRGGGKKPWRQKGTGNARAGSKRSPLWVGGAVALGPKPRKTVLILPKKMKRKALISSLSQKAAEGAISVISNFESIKPKTKVVVNLLSKTSTNGSTLVVTSQNSQSIRLASRNISNVSVDEVRNLNPYSVYKSRKILFSKEALGKLS